MQSSALLPVRHCVRDKPHPSELGSQPAGFKRAVTVTVTGGHLVLRPWVRAKRFSSTLARGGSKPRYAFVARQGNLNVFLFFLGVQS